MMLELCGLRHDRQDQLSVLLPKALNSAVVSPMQDLCIHWSQSSHAIHLSLHALEQMPLGYFNFLGPGFGSIPLRRSKCLL